VDLAPTDDADKDGVYSEAIRFAISKEKVSNIAITGPYGSGKSSIIHTFLKTYRQPALHISLASFVPEVDSGGEQVSRQEIERSILQQMLYGADANKLPLSRFKRIQSPGVWSIFKSLYILIGLLALWYVFYQREGIISGTFFLPISLSNWLNLGSFTLAGTFLWVALHHFYVASFGLSLKSISLKDVEIKPASDDQASILNRHLDEIIYFFQSTKYDLVIIEDLDRFNNADIFVTLREINSLINENAGVKRTIRFLYALRDDMFENTDRTKFFEFIIPVIPIINSSNSIDMVLKQGKRLDLNTHLDRQFLREVSRYLNDLRLIQNIFNEYSIYVGNLDREGENQLNKNKLLAILIYKNVYPRDFEKLHRDEGILANILNLKDVLIEQGESKYRSDIAALENQLEVAEQQTPIDLRELRQIYAMALIEKFPAHGHSVSHDNHRIWITIPQLANHEAFEQFIESRHIHVRNAQNGIIKTIDITKFQEEVDSQKSYQQRKEEIDSKVADNKSKTLSQIRNLRAKLADLRMTRLNELLRLNPKGVQDLFTKFEGNGELARFLILEGHLDDTYYQYTSLFHSGRLSPNDNKFLIQIRAFINPEPDFPIDNPKEVIAAMRDEDFGQAYALNIKIVDSLLSDPSRYSTHTKKLFRFFSADFTKAEKFFIAYYTSGTNVAALLSGLANIWNGLIPAMINSHINVSHVTQLVSSQPEVILKKFGTEFNGLSEFVADNLPEILGNIPELEPNSIACLDIEVKDLDAIKEHTLITRFMFERGLFALNITNLEFVFQEILGSSDIEAFRARNFTTIRSMENETLLNRVERDFDIYLREVLIELEGNTEEDIPAMLAVLRHIDLDLDDIFEFFQRQRNLLPTLEGVPENSHAMLFKLGKIEPTWLNCLNYIEEEIFEPGSLVEYLDREDVRGIIVDHVVPKDEDFRKLRRFLFEANSLSDDSYKDYIHVLPRPFPEFPEGVGPDKLRILIDESKVTFTKDSLDELHGSWDLQVKFVEANIGEYLKDPDSFALDDEFREELLGSEISNEHKLKIIELMDLDALVSLPKRSALVGPILSNRNAKISNINGAIVRSLIINSSPVSAQILLFNKYHSHMTDDEVRDVLVNLPKPFSEIKTGYRTPKLKNTNENQDLVRWLDKRNIISSWSESTLFDDTIRVNLYRR
jgi:hypothetical protein